MDDEHETVLRDRDWWQSAGDVLGLKLFGFTYRAVGSFRDPSDHDATVNLTGKVAERLIAMTAPSNPAEVGAHERKRAVAAIHWVFSADGTKSERSMADEAINKINDPTFMPLAAAPSPPIGDTGGGAVDHIADAGKMVPGIIGDTGGVGEDGELQILAEQSAENMRLIDWIADRIGLPHDEELSRSNFDTFLAALVPARVEAVDGWQSMETAPTNGKHCILAVPEPSGFVYSVQGAYQDGQWNAVHRDNVKPLAWMPNTLLPEHLRPRAAIQGNPS